MKSTIGYLGMLGVALALCGATSECNLDPNVATASQVEVVVNAYNAGVATGTNYLRLPLCSATLTQVCRTQVLSQQVYTALKSGRAARNELLADLANGTTLNITAVQALQAAYSVISSIPANGG